MTLGLVALVAQLHALPGVDGAGINSPEVIAVASALVILLVVPTFTHWRK